MVSKIKLWWYDQIIHQSLEKFANGNLKLQPFADTVKSFFCARTAEEELGGTKYDESYGKRMIWNFVTSVIPALTNEATSIKDIADGLKQGILYLDEALLSKFSEEENADRIITDLKSLKSETVLLAIVKFLDNKSESRIIYNRNKDCLSRFQKDGIKCVLQELLDPKKVLVPYAQYLKLIQELAHKVVSGSRPTLISKIAQICSERSKDGDGFDKLVDDVDSPGEENKDLESNSEASSPSPQGSSVTVTDGETTHRKVHSSIHGKSIGDDIDILEVSPTPHQRKLPQNSLNTGSNKKNRRPPRPQSVTVGGVFKRPSITLKPVPRPPVSEGERWKRQSEDQLSSRASYTSRHKRQFTPLQDAYIIMGMQKFGTHKREWKKILQNYPFPEYRTPVHLKDRWRTLLNQGQVKVNHGELILRDKYTSLINYLSTKKMPDKENDQKNHKTRKRRQKPEKHDNPETPDLSYLSPADLSDAEDREPVPVPGLEHVRRWIKTGTAVTDERPQSRIPPLLITKKDKQDETIDMPRATRANSGETSKKQLDSASNRESNVNKMSGTSDKSTDSNPPNRAGTSGKQETAADHIAVGGEMSQSEETDSPHLSPELITTYKEYEYEKNSNGKYIRKQKKVEKNSGSKQAVNGRSEAQSNQDVDANNITSQDKRFGKVADDEVIDVGSEVKESASDKTLLPPEDDEDDVDLICEMEKENSLQVEEEDEQNPQSTLEMLNKMSSESKSQMQSQSSSCTEESYFTPTQSSSTTLKSSQNSVEQLRQESQSTLDLLQGFESQEEEKNSPDIACSLGQSASEGENQSSSPMLSSSKKAVDEQIHHTSAQTPETQRLRETVSETSAEVSADEMSGMLKLQLSESEGESLQDLNSSVTSANLKLHLDQDEESDSDSAMLVIDEGLSDDDINKTVVNECEPENAAKQQVENRSDAEHTSDGGYTTAVDVQEKGGNPADDRTDLKHASDLNSQDLKSLEARSPALSTAGSNLDPCSPISEYYTASEGSQPENDKHTSHNSDAEEEEENDTTVIQNATLTDGDIPNNIEQWIAENPSSYSSEIQENTRDLLSRLGTEQGKSSQERDPLGDDTRVKTELAGSSDDSLDSSDSNTLLNTILSPGPDGTEPPSVPDGSGLEVPHGGIKREYNTSDDMLKPPQPTITDLKEYKFFSLHKMPILSLERVKVEPGVFPSNVGMHTVISSDDDSGEVTQGPTGPRSGVDNNKTSSNTAMNSVIVELEGSDITPLDLTVKRKKHLAIKSTGGRNGTDKYGSRPRLAVKSTGGSKSMKSKASGKAGKKAAIKKRKKNSSSRSDENLTDVTNGSDASTASGTKRKKHAAVSKKRKIVLRDEGVPVKLSRGDALLFDSVSEASMSKEFETFGKAKRGRRKAWSQEEDDNLAAGVQRFGEGRWKSILDHYQFRNRTVVNLKDRFRILKEN